MRYKIDFIDNHVVITADPSGRYESIEELKTAALRFHDSYRSVRLNSVESEAIDVSCLSNEELDDLIIKPKPTFCPKCEYEMEIGLCFTKTSFWGFIMWGFSHKDLVFQGVDGKDSVILPNNTSTTAYKCQTCGLVMIP